MEKYKYYLFDLGEIIKRRALEARQQREAAQGDESEALFQQGRMIAFNEVISIMQQQAEGFEISLSDLQLADIEPDRDLTWSMCGSIQL